MATLPEGDDPDTYITREGADAFKQAIQDAKEFFTVKMKYATANTDISSIRDRAQLANEMAGLIAHVGDKMTKEALINQVATQLGIGTEEMRSEVILGEKAVARSQFFEKRQDAKNALRAKENEPTVQATAINLSVAYLCHLALTSKAAQEWLSEQLESLIDPLDSLAGGFILRAILNKLPDPESTASVQTYITTLSAEDQAALRAALNNEEVTHPVQQAEEASNMLINTYFQNKDASIRARLKDPNISSQEMVDLMKEASDLQLILKNLKQRFIR